MPVDYSKFDNIGDSDDEKPQAGGGGGAYTEEERKQFQDAAARAQAPPASDNPRGEIERLKAERRAKRDAEPAAAAPAAPAAVDDSPAAPAVAAEEEDGPLSQLAAAERLVDTIRVSIASVEASLAAGLTAGDEIAAALKTCVTINSSVGKLQNDLDGISIGSLDDEARDLAKARRKKLNAALEEELMPGGNAVRAKVVKAKNAAGA